LNLAEPLAVYIHWPYCARICPYCDFNVVRDRGQAEQAALARAIVRDLEGQAALTGPRLLGSIFFGGGTPSLMDPAWAAAMIAAARRLWAPDADLEISLEANPTDAEAHRFAAFAEAGIARLSLGVQALDDAALKALGRNHGAAEALRAAALAASIFPRLSIDLIYARPGQAPKAWAAELNAALAFAPEHVSPYQLTIEPGTAFERAVRRGALVPPGVDAAADLYETTQAVLADAGYEAYEVSNHARGAAARSRHNLAYWRGWDYVGAGPGAHGRLTLGGVRTATAAERGVGDYVAAVERTGVGFAEQEALAPRDVALERLLMGLRTSEGVAFADLAPIGLGQGDPRLGGFADAGLIQVRADRLHATLDGRRVLDRLIANLAD
jgi:putative oxygen-independent coproporphyrinogen III oxidase